MVKNLNDVLAKTFFIGLFWILDFMSDCDGHNKNHMPLPESHELWKRFHLLCCKILWLLQALLGIDSFCNIWVWSIRWRWRTCSIHNWSCSAWTKGYTYQVSSYELFISWYVSRFIAGRFGEKAVLKGCNNDFQIFYTLKMTKTWTSAEAWIKI